jgi:hypothetical protein
MGTYNLSANELAELILNAIKNAEGDYTDDELKKALKIFWERRDERD